MIDWRPISEASKSPDANDVLLCVDAQSLQSYTVGRWSAEHEAWVELSLCGCERIVFATLFAVITPPKRKR
jgi:hypothetical protein